MPASMSLLNFIRVRGPLLCLAACLLMLADISMNALHRCNEAVQTRSAAIDKVKQTRPQVRVLVAIMTCPSNVDKVLAVNNTWAKHCDKIIFFSTETHPDLPIIALNVTEGYKHLTAKTMTGFQYIYDHYFHDFDWFMKADDDTYVIMENLRHFLSTQNTSEPLYTGQYFVQEYHKRGFNSGGSGYVLSKEALRRFGQRGNNSKCKHDLGGEDIEMGTCLESMGVRVLPSRDDRGRNRFHQISPADAIAGKIPKVQCDYDKALCPSNGSDSISDYPISFHHVSPTTMVELEYYVYRLRPFKQN